MSLPTTRESDPPKATSVGTLAPDVQTLPSPDIGTKAVRPASRSRAPEKENRVANQPAFVLHSYPYKETSLIVEVFSRDYGRVALIAKGAKRPHSRLRGVLQTFQPLSVSWSGKAEVRTLTSAEWIGGLLPLEKSALLCGFYLNELLVKLLARDDPHSALFDHYVATLNQLAHDEPAPIVLRKFERALLKETGVGGDFTQCTTTGLPVSAEQIYVVDPERGPRLAHPADNSPRVSGKTLLDMEHEDYSDSATQLQSKFLMRFLLSHHLGGAPLNTRQILIDLMQL
ncbi:MAG TPA: DNA repair protein RecO [Noviherbaspirillum sp.]|uniref:DNA repair protein RecO n=1 Tax=Noviherbaspirillum sp. TaxID=1926288 RepID=UPI002B494E5B|nr:DNA repair protein RecO [Noviherbaspirillum sp.]HJV87041.1 DNA repair protein RecO [Noviherbaspirillum sp.]